MRSRNLLLVLLLFPTLTFAQSVPAPSINPPNPTSATPITITVWEYDTCVPPPEVGIEGRTITIKMGFGPCLSPPLLLRHDVSIGTLEPGDYDVVVFDDIQRAGFTTFLVRDAVDRVQITPSLLPTTGGVVTIVADVHHCSGSPSCVPPVITFDGIPATNVVVLDTFRFRATAPAHAAGTVDVVVSPGTQYSKEERAAFTYFDPNAAPRASAFTRVLFPVVFSGAGAFGSQWTTELTLRNETATAIPMWRAIDAGAAIPPASPLRFDFQTAHSGGALLFVPRDSASTVRFNALVRDTSRQAADWGTEIPVVREDDAPSRSAVEMLNVPLDARFRQTLRIYGLDSVNENVIVSILAMPGGEQLVRRAVPLVSAHPCERFIPCASDDPAFAMIGDFPTFFPELAGKS
ncbi:MAG TPA: hypothetical protein VJZ00_21785, partial [Thermoanaerobaculia bacterium]|nr:hypothetical protein [Thermoanaerobaculia bacterium]